MVVTYNKAEGKPRMTLDDMAAIITTVVALTDDAVIPLNLFAEGVFATGEYDTHNEVVPVNFALAIGEFAVRSRRALLEIPYIVR